MSEETQIVRKCKDCPDTTHTVCCFAFGTLWRDKSRKGRGCAHPLDEVAEAWRKDGWRPGEEPRVRLKLPMDEQKPQAARKAATYRQTSLFSAPAEPPPLSEDDY